MDGLSKPTIQEVSKLPPARKQWEQPVAPPKKQPPSSNNRGVVHNFKREQDQIESANINEIKVRDNDGLDDDDDDSDGSEIGGDREIEEAKQNMKKGKQDDWNYLKQTLNSKNTKGTNWGQPQ